MNLPEAIVFVAIEPKTNVDQDKLAQGLQKLMSEDPTLRVNTDSQTGQTIMRGTSDLHLERNVERLIREFSVGATVGRVQVAYKETVTRPTEGQGRYARQIGGHGQYGHAKIRLAPGGRGTGYHFENHVIDGAVPKQFIKSIEEGVREALTCGVLGYPVDDVRVELYDGSFHEIDSSEIAFKVAGSMALQDAEKKAEPILLEPIMGVEVETPEDYIGNVIDDINSRRGQIQDMEQTGTTRIIKASVPLSELFSYAANVNLRTQGRGSYSMRFYRYEPRYGGPDADDEDCGAPVTTPRSPAPKGKAFGVAHPKPDTKPET